MQERIKRRVYDLLEKHKDDDIQSWYVDVGIQTIIILNVTAVILETVDSLHDYAWAFHSFEVFSVGIFVVEYVLRLWSCTINERFKHPVFGRLRYAVTILAVIDLLAILPALIPFYADSSMSVVRILRLFRLFRLLKIARYTDAFVTLKHVLHARSSELAFTFFIVFILMILSASMMYFVEGGAKTADDTEFASGAEVVDNTETEGGGKTQRGTEGFESIPHAMWWSVATLSTVGYGDVVPKTSLGKLIASFVAILGISLFAIPAGIIGSGFVDEAAKRRQQAFCCPHCGKDIQTATVLRRTDNERRRDVRAARE